jgi:5'-phosphate synthase pdxT subunit
MAARARPLIGVLALQGDFAAHGRRLEELGVPWVRVRRPEDLGSVDGLIIPGGESTTLLRLMAANGLEEPLRRFGQTGRPIFGTCAGLILLANEVCSPCQPSLGLLDVAVQRNAYGRQIDSFETCGEWLGPGGPCSMEMVFIRAPRIRRVGPSVAVLARLGQEPVLVHQGTVLGATFHPELARETLVHRFFLDLCQRRS